jgi:hypothetical protein
VITSQVYGTAEAVPLQIKFISQAVGDGGRGIVCGLVEFAQPMQARSAEKRRKQRREQHSENFEVEWIHDRRPMICIGDRVEMREGGVGLVSGRWCPDFELLLPRWSDEFNESNRRSLRYAFGMTAVRVAMRPLVPSLRVRVDSSEQS